MMAAAGRLVGIKLLHTAAWALFAGCILAMPIATAVGDLRVASALWAVVLIEVMILAFNGWRCPLTPIAARFTSDRRPNFDIYLPEFLARYNREIFGTLYAVGTLFLLYRWAAG